jgi:hypothetical protein
MRGNLRQVQASARTVWGTPAVAPRQYAEFILAELLEIGRPIDHMVWKGCDLLLQRGVFPCADGIGHLVERLHRGAYFGRVETGR